MFEEGRSEICGLFRLIIGLHEGAGVFTIEETSNTGELIGHDHQNPNRL
jgi:hypothetical protein